MQLLSRFLFRTLTAMLLCLSTTLFMSSPAKAIDVIDITGAETRKIPAAVPYFTGKGGDPKTRDGNEKMAALMTEGLEFHGFLSVIPPARYGGSQSTDWKQLGVEYVVLGQYEVNGENIAMDFRLLDIAEGGSILAKRLTGSVSDRNSLILKFCDEVIGKLSDTPGISQTKIAFVSDGSGAKEIYIADVLGENIKRVTRHQFIATSPRLAPDGYRLAYTSYHHGNPDLYVTDIRQSKTTKAISWQSGLNISAAWHPKGGPIAMTMSRDDNPDIYLIDDKGQIIERLTSDAGINVSPNWSPDGSMLAFVSDRTGSPQVYVMDIKAKVAKRLTFTGNYNTSPSWSPNGKLIAYAGMHEGSYHIFTISPDGGSGTCITHAAGNHESPSWSPDSKQIVFSRQRGSKTELCAVFANGSGLRPLFTTDGNQTMPNWGPKTN